MVSPKRFGILLLLYNNKRHRAVTFSKRGRLFEFCNMSYFCVIRECYFRSARCKLRNWQRICTCLPDSSIFLDRLNKTPSAGIRIMCAIMTAITEAYNIYPCAGLIYTLSHPEDENNCDVSAWYRITRLLIIAPVISVFLHTFK